VGIGRLIGQSHLGRSQNAVAADTTRHPRPRPPQKPWRRRPSRRGDTLPTKADLAFGGSPARMPRPIIILPDPPPPPTAIGLIAGGGRLPIRIAEGLREAGHRVCGLGLARQYDR